MLGAIIGDIIGSRFEWNNIKSKEFELFAPACCPTDDSVMTLAIAKAIMESTDENGQVKLETLSENAVQYMQTVGRQYPDCGYGGRFFGWLFSDDPKPYYSYGNGSAMRVSPAGDAAHTLTEAVAYAKAVSEVTHDHPEGIRGGEATAAAIFMARSGSTKEEIRQHICEHYYTIDFTLDEIRDAYTFDVSCQGSVPQALEAFFESTDFEDAVRNAISIGGDSDTIAAITGGIAEAYYGIPKEIADEAITYLDPLQRGILREWYSR